MTMTEEILTSYEEKYQFLRLTSGQFLERRISTLYGIDSNAMRALDLVTKEMCAEKGFTRDDGQDYYVHCTDVANTIISFGIKDEDVVCAALLHDLIEDVKGYTEEAVAGLFNTRVAHLVLLVTKLPDRDYHQPEVINEYLDTISKDMYAAAIKTADRMHNMMTLSEKTFEAKVRKCLETETYYLPFFKKCRKLYPRYENLFYAARTQIQPLIYEIKTFYAEIEKLRSENAELRKQIEDLKGDGAQWYTALFSISQKPMWNKIEENR